MPVAALVCRLTAWFVLGAGVAGALFFVGYDGLGVPVALFLVVLSLALAVMLWALGRVCAETARIARRLAPLPAEATPSRLPWRRAKAAAPPPATPTPAATPAATPEPAARPMTPDEIDEFFGRPQSLAAHRARRTDRG